MIDIPSGRMNATKTKQWVGFDVDKGGVTVLHLADTGSGPLTVELDETWPLQKGARSAAYHVMFQRVAGYIRDRSVDAVRVLGSAVSGHPAKLGQLQGAELRGVIMAAAASVVRDVDARSKGDLSNQSERGKVQLYTDDDEYWQAAVAGTFRKGSREVAYLLLKEARPEDAEV